MFAASKQILAGNRMAAIRALVLAFGKGQWLCVLKHGQGFLLAGLQFSQA